MFLYLIIIILNTYNSRSYVNTYLPGRVIGLALILVLERKRFGKKTKKTKQKSFYINVV